MRTSLSLLLVVSLAAATHHAQAQQACVRCDNPFAIYNCQVEGPGVPANAPVHLLCMTELAKRYGHATCAVSRNETGECTGQLVTVTPSPDAPIPQALPPALAVSPDDQLEAAPGDETETGELEAPAEEPAEEGNPKTVEELAKQTAKASQEGLKKAGEGVADVAKKAGDGVADVAKKTGETMEKTGNAIGSAAKKTWRCLSSFFGDC
jgi:hypothetical protein